jgi:hypothetical protein
MEPVDRIRQQLPRPLHALRADLRLHERGAEAPRGLGALPKMSEFSDAQAGDDLTGATEMQSGIQGRSILLVSEPWRGIGIEAPSDARCVRSWRVR